MIAENNANLSVLSSDNQLLHTSVEVPCTSVPRHLLCSSHTTGSCIASSPGHSLLKPGYEASSYCNQIHTHIQVGVKIKCPIGTDLSNLILEKRYTFTYIIN